MAGMMQTQVTERNGLCHCRALLLLPNLKLLFRGVSKEDDAPPTIAEPETLPTTVLTGFLGSGKTTLFRRALVSPAFGDTAVIVNEIGEIAIDHHLVDFVEGSVLELPGGCLCCAVREDWRARCRPFSSGVRSAK